MRILSALLIITAILLGGVYFLLFTQTGNDILKPYITQIASEKSGQKIEIKKLSLKPDSLDITAMINESVFTKVSGDINIFKQNFNLEYFINADELKLPKQKPIKTELDIKGIIKGDIKNIYIEGDGKAFKSPINYSLSVIDNIPQNIKANVTKAKLEEILALLAKPAYIKGVADLNINIPKFDLNNLNGKAKLILYESIIENSLIKRDFNIELPKNTKIKGEVNSNLNKTFITTSAKIFSTLADLEVKKSVVDTSKKDLWLKSDYQVIAKLSNIEPIVKMPLRGDFKINGNLLLNGKKYRLDGVSRSLGGEVKFNLNGDKLDFIAQNTSISKILYILGQKELSKGELNIKGGFSSLSNLTGKASLSTKNASLNTAVIKKEFNIDLGKNFPYSLNADADFKKDIILAKAKLITPIKEVDIQNIKYSLKDGKLTADYVAYIKDLSKLQPIIGKKLKGDIKISGDIKMDKELIVTGDSKKFGGDIKFLFKGTKTHIEASNVSVAKILEMALYPTVADGKAFIKADYDISTKKGKSEAKIETARILRSTFTDLIATFTHHDLAKERFNETTFTSVINNDKVVFNFNARSKNSYISFKQGKLNIKTNRIEAPFDILIKGKDFKGMIKGDINKPKIKLNTSKYLKEKAVNKVEKLIEKKLGEDKAEKLKGILNIFK